MGKGDQLYGDAMPIMRSFCRDRMFKLVRLVLLGLKKVLLGVKLRILFVLGVHNLVHCHLSLGIV